jgi:hypothetical protein
MNLEERVEFPENHDAPSHPDRHPDLLAFDIALRKRNGEMVLEYEHRLLEGR